MTLRGMGCPRVAHRSDSSRPETARSALAARPNAARGTRDMSRVSLAGERTPWDTHASARSNATCQAAVASPIADVATAVTT